MDVGQLNEACRALGRVVEENSGKVGAESVDVDVLDRLVDGVTRASGNEDIDEDPNRGRQLFKSVNDLFERTILPRVSSYRIFRAYGRLGKKSGQKQSKRIWTPIGTGVRVRWRRARQT